MTRSISLSGLVNRSFQIVECLNFFYIFRIACEVYCCEFLLPCIWELSVSAAVMLRGSIKMEVVTVHGEAVAVFVLTSILD